MMKILNSVAEMIGQTPLVSLSNYKNEYKSSFAFNRPIWIQITDNYKKALIIVLLSLRKTTTNNHNTNSVTKESNLPLMEGKECAIFLFIMGIT